MNMCIFCFMYNLNKSIIQISMFVNMCILTWVVFDIVITHVVMVKKIDLRKIFFAQPYKKIVWCTE